MKNGKKRKREKDPFSDLPDELTSSTDANDADELAWKIERLQTRILEIEMTVKTLETERMRYKKQQLELRKELQKFQPKPIKTPADKVYAPLTLRQRREQVQDVNVGDGAVREIGGKKQFWWRGGWRDV